MISEFEELQEESCYKLLNIYKKRLEQLKKSILKLVKAGSDTSTLRIEKRKLEKIIKELEYELYEYAEQESEQIYYEGQKEQNKYFKALNIAIIGLIANETVIKNLEDIYLTNLSNIPKNITNKVKAYVRTDFSNKQETIKALNNIADTNLLASTVTNKNSYELAKLLEEEFKQKDIFTIPYYDKNGNIVRRVKASTYANMLSRTMTANIFREGAKESIIKNVPQGDLVEILGKSKYPDSPCLPYQGSILSLSGKTEGYVTIDEAKGNGLFHPNCIHSFAVTQNVLNEYKQRA